MPLLSKSEFSSFYPVSVGVRPGLCRTWSETEVINFLMQRFMYEFSRWKTMYAIKVLDMHISLKMEVKCTPLLTETLL